MTDHDPVNHTRREAGAEAPTPEIVHQAHHFDPDGQCRCIRACCNTTGGACTCPDCSGRLCLHDDRRAARSAS